MKAQNYIIISMLSICIVSCHDYLCDGFGTSTEYVPIREFEEVQLQPNESIEIDLNDYWQFEYDDGCNDIKIVDRGIEKITIQDPPIAKFDCPTTNNNFCSDSTWQDPVGDNIFTIEATKVGSTRVHINLTYSDVTTINKDYNFLIEVSR